MKQGILAATLLAASAGFASADYVIIVANVGGEVKENEEELKTAGAAGQAQGMRGGMMMGMRGGMMMGMRGGMMMGMRGGQGPGMPGGMMMGMRGGPGQGMRGGMMMGMRGGQARGMPGGMMMGMRGGMMMGMRGGMMMGMRGMRGMWGGPIDADDLPYFVIAVVEVKAKNLLQKLQRDTIATVQLPPHLGRACNLLRNPPFGEIYVIIEGKKPIPTVSQRFQEEYNKATKDTPSAGEILRVAQWALEHGLVDEFPKVMDRLVEIDKGHSAAVAYQKIKAALERKAGDDPSVASWQGKLLPGYKVKETPHYLIVHNAAKDTAATVETHAEHLENTLRGFYYWFALKGIALPVPRNRQVVILTRKADDFEQLHKILASAPVVVDGFFARRENLAVMSSQRRDDTYTALKTFWKLWQDKGFHRSELLLGRSSNGVPKSGAPKLLLRDYKGKGRFIVAQAQMVALMLKALEQEAELATVSHDASRQLLFASGLLPRNVAVPEWILFGMGSFFETPLQSPWQTIGAPSPYYLPRWRELKNKGSNKGGLEKTRVQTLRKVVTDGYFRLVPPDGKADSPMHRLREAALRRARTVSWSLTYYLAQQKLEGLRHYFAELSKMPRDLELDDTVLLGCFARAFGCVDSNNKIDEARLKALADGWYAFMQKVHFESETTMKGIREQIAKKVEEAQKQDEKQEENNNNGGRPGMFPGRPGGGFPPGGSGGFPPNGPQQGGRRNFPPNGPAPGGGGRSGGGGRRGGGARPGGN